MECRRGTTACLTSCGPPRTFEAFAGEDAVDGAAQRDGLRECSWRKPQPAGGGWGKEATEVVDAATHEEGMVRPSGAASSARITLATNIRRPRRLRDLSSAQLARLSHVGPATLSGLERGVGNPPLDTLQTLSATLGVPLTGLLDGATRSPVTVVRATQGARVRRPNLELRFVHRFASGGLDVVELYEMTALPGDPHTRTSCAASFPTGWWEATTALPARCATATSPSPTRRSSPETSPGSDASNRATSHTGEEASRRVTDGHRDPERRPHC